VLNWKFLQHLLLVAARVLSAIRPRVLANAAPARAPVAATRAKKH
jgi:hypothetical protein